MHRGTAGGQEIQLFPPLPCSLSLPSTDGLRSIQTHESQSAPHRRRTETSALVCLEKLSAHSLSINQAASTPASEAK